MTELLERAIAPLKTLPADEQDAIAALIMELEDNRRWDEAFSRSPEVLDQLAASAMAELIQKPCETTHYNAVPWTVW